MNQIARLDPVTGSTRARFTTAEFMQMVAAGAFADMNVELIDGELQRMNPPMNGHGARQAMVIGSLWAIVRAAGLEMLGEAGIAIGEDMVVACDAAIVRGRLEERSLLAPANIILAVEISDTTLARDLGLKRTLYATAGVPVYWVIDGMRRVTHVHSEPVDGEYALISTVRFGEPLAVPGTDATIVLD